MSGVFVSDLNLNFALKMEIDDEDVVVHVSTWQITPIIFIENRLPVNNIFDVFSYSVYSNCLLNVCYISSGTRLLS